MLAFTLVLLLGQQPKISDAKLLAVCASVQTHIDEYEEGRAPKARLESLLHKKPTATEYAGICYALGISGYKPAEMTKRLMSFICFEIPTPKVKDGEDVGVGLDVDRIYHRFPTDATLGVIIECQGDGTGADYTSNLTRKILIERPRQVMRVTRKKHVESAIANNLWYESGALEAKKTNATLRKLARDRDPKLSETAIKIAHKFIQEYNDNYGGDPGQPKLLDWTAKRTRRNSFHHPGRGL